MSLRHDPSAIRFASTQEAYGSVWTLDKVESDGAQIWKNSKGQAALIQRLPEEGMWIVDVRSFDRCLTNEEVVKLYNEGPDSVPGGQVIDLTDPTNEQTIAEIDRLIASGIDAKYAKTLESCKQAMQSGRVSSTHENVNNAPRSDGVIEIDLQQVHKAMYLSPVDMAIRARDARRQPGECRVSADGKQRWTWDGTRWNKS